MNGISRTFIFSFLASSSFLVGCASKPKEPIQNAGLMKQSYVLCSSRETNYNLILENAAVGEATGIKIVDPSSGHWKEITKRPITEVKTNSAPEGSKIYLGPEFNAIRKLTVDGQRTRKDEVYLTISIDKNVLKANFFCSKVE